MTWRIIRDSEGDVNRNRQIAVRAGCNTIPLSKRMKRGQVIVSDEKLFYGDFLGEFLKNFLTDPFYLYDILGRFEISIIFTVLHYCGSFCFTNSWKCGQCFLIGGVNVDGCNCYVYG